MNAWEKYKQDREQRKQEEAERFSGSSAWENYKANRQPVKEEEQVSSSAAAKAEREKIRNRLETVKGIVPTIPDENNIVGGTSGGAPAEVPQQPDEERQEEPKNIGSIILEWLAKIGNSGDSTLPMSNATQVINYLRDNPEAVQQAVANRESIETQKQAEADRLQQWANEHKGAATAASVVSSPLSMVDYLQQLVEVNAVGHSLPSENLKPAEITETLRGGVSQDMSEAGKFLYNTAMSGVDSLLAGTMSGGMSGVGALILGGGAASSAMNDIKNRGGDDQQAVIGGAAAGAFEAIFEKMSLGQLNALKEMPVDGAKTLLKNIAKTVFTNASEEAATELANGLFDAYLMEDLANYDLTTAEGRRDLAKQVGLSALAGGIMGGVFGGVGSLGGYMNNRETEREGAQLLQNALDIQQNGAPVINETDTAPIVPEQTINTDTISGKEADRIMADPARMEALGIDTSGMTKSQARSAVKQAVAAQGNIQTPTAPQNAQKAVSEAETQRRMGAGEMATAVLGENGAKAFRAAYTSDVASRVDERAAATGFNTVYKANLDGRAMTEQEKSQTESLPQELRVAAESSAMLDRQRASQATYFGESAGLLKDDSFKKAHLSYKTTTTLDAVAKAAGVQIRFVDKVADGAANASYDNGVIEIALDSNDPVMTAFTHEIVHRIRETSPQHYTAMAEFVQRYIGANAKTKLGVHYSSKYGTTDVSYYTEEMVADAFGTILRDSEAMSQFAKDDRNAFQKLLDAVRDLINAVKRALNGQNVELSREQKTAFMALQSKLTEMENTLVKALESVPQSAEKNTATEGGEAKMSLKHVNGKQIVWVENSNLTNKQLSDYSVVEAYIAEHIGEVYTIIESGQKVYIGEDLPGEFTHSKYTNSLLKRNPQALKAKKKAASEFGLLIETATNRRWEKTKHAESKDAKYGMYRYDTSFAFPIKNADGTFQRVRAYDAELLIRNASDGKKYLYDVVGIKENTTDSSDLTNREIRGGSYKAAASGSASDESVTQPMTAVNPEIETRMEQDKPVSAFDGVRLSLKWDSKYMDAAESANKGKVSKSVMKAAREARQAVADIFNDPDLADSLGLPPDIIGNTYIPNGSYAGTEENTTVCIRSIAADDLMDAVAEHLGRPLTVEDTVAISQEYWKYTDRPECLYCYVAMDRKAHREFLGSYLKQRDEVLDNIHNGMDVEEAYETFLDGRKPTTPMRNRFDMWLRNDGKAQITPNDLASYSNMEKAIERNGALRAQINDALKYAQSASWAKKRLSYAAYNNHILRWAQSRIDNLNSNYGLRMYSFSDFSPAFILENMQMITDASVRGLKMLAYTKELDFVRIFANTGANINISVFGYDDGNGGVAMDAMQGADWAQAQALRGEHSNVGITFVATNDSQVEWALEQDWIDVVIPFHLVRTGKRVASYFGWKDYTAMSSDTKKKEWTTQNAKSILPPQHQNDKAKYLAACEANNLEPRFADWVDHPSYMKLVNETRQSEGNTNPVQPVFDVDAARESIETMRKQGGYYTPIGGSYDNMRDIAEEIAHNISGERASLKSKEGDFAEAAKAAIKDAQLAGMMNQGRKDAEKLRKAKEKTTEVRQKRDETIKALKEHQRGREAAMRESRNASAIRAKIMRHVTELSRKLRNPTDKKHVPEALRGPVGKLLESINLESRDGAPTKRTQAFNELKKVYAEIAENLVIDPDLLGGEGTTGLLDDVIAMADKRIADMNTEELDTIWKAIRAIEASIRTANKAFSAGRFQTIQEAADALRSDNLFKRSKTEWNYIEKLQKLTSVDMLTPEAYFHRLGKAGDAIFRMMRNAQDKHIRLMKQVSDFTNENLSDVDVRALEKEMHTVKLGGQDVEMSTAQLMELYALMRRQQAMEHLVEGGILPDVVSKKGLKKSAKAEPIHGVSADELMEAVGVLTEEQVQIAEMLQEYASTVLSDFGNEASMEVYGYRKFTEPHYWPIRSNRQEVKSDVQKDTQTTSVANRGFTKNVKPHANNSVMVGSIFDTFASHSSDMATYAAWLGASEDVNRIRNFVFRADGKTVGTVKGILDRVHGTNKGQQYLQKLLADIANGVKGVDVSASLTGGLMGNYKAASVGANLRVVIQQPTSILRAFDMVDPKYFLPAMKPNHGFEKAKKYAPIAQWKDWGYFDIHTGRQMKDVLFDSASAVDKVKETSMALAGKMDSLSWGILWNAVEAETKAKTELTPGTEAFYQKVAERFNEVIDRTQVVDGILQRSQIMRDPGDLKKMVTSFMGEPTKQYNMLLSAAYDAKNGAGGGKRALVRTGFSLVTAAVLNAAAQSIIDAFRDDDREQDYWEKWLEAFVGVGADEGSAVMRYLNSNVGSAFNPMGYLPYVKDVWSLIQGYDVSRMDMDSIDKTISAASNLMKALQGEGKATIGSTVITMLAELSKVAGVPVANLKREVTSFALTLAMESNNHMLEYRIRKVLYKVPENTTMYYDILYSAMQNDADAYEAIYADMIKSGLTEEKVKKGMETRMKNDQGVNEVADLEQRWMSPDQKGAYDAYLRKMERNPIWRNAKANHRAEAENLLYEYVTGSTAGDKMAEKLEDGIRYGVDETEYMLYKLALSMTDKPTETGNYGSYTNEEVKAAIDMLKLGKKESAWLWEAQGKSEKSNPYK